MSKKTFNVNLFSTSSLMKLQRELEQYRDGLQGKCEQLVTRLAEMGEQVALQHIGSSPIGSNITLKSTHTVEEMGCKAVLMATGKVVEAEGREPFYTVLAVEFGAGIYYNRGAGNPLAGQFGFGVGTYPGQIHAFEDGWYYLGTDDKWHYTHGIKATMPMYYADMEILKNYSKVLKEVFG